MFGHQFNCLKCLATFKDRWEEIENGIEDELCMIGNFRTFA